MSDAVLVALIVAFPPTLMALLGVFVSLRNAGKLQRTEAAVEVVHIAINSRLDELLKTTARLAHAEGHRAAIEAVAGAKAEP